MCRQIFPRQDSGVIIWCTCFSRIKKIINSGSELKTVLLSVSNCFQTTIVSHNFCWPLFHTFNVFKTFFLSAALSSFFLQASKSFALSLDFCKCFVMNSLREECHLLMVLLEFLDELMRVQEQNNFFASFLSFLQLN